MSGRALVVGAAHRPSADGRSAAELDAEWMAELLQRRGFALEVLAGPAATRDAILAGYAGLIEAVGPGEAAAIYLAGHGGIAHDLGGEPIDKAGPTTVGPALIPRLFQFFVPSDYLASTEADFRGISSLELSLLLAALTRRTPNVTVITDCCHAAQLSRGRDDGGEPRAIEPTRISVGRHLAAVAARRGGTAALDPKGNPDAVRIAACGEWQQAFTRRERGRRTGLLTHALIATLEEVGDAPVSWRAIGAAIRERVHRRASTQLPIVDGPVRRRPFSLAEAGAGSIAIAPGAEGLRLAAGRIAGVSPGDTYGVTALDAAGFAPEAAVARVRVEHVSARHAVARAVEWMNGRAEVPEPAVAWPLELALARQPIRVAAPEGERAAPEYERTALEAAVAGAARLRIAAPDEAAVGELRLEGGALRVLRGDGAAIRPASGAWTLEDALRQLGTLAAAQALRELQGEGMAAAEIEVEWGTVSDRMRTPQWPDGAAVRAGERIYVRIRNRSAEVRYAHAFNIGLCGRISRLSEAAGMGIWLRPLGEAFVGPAGDPAPSFVLRWPDCRAPEAPDVDRLAVIVTAGPVDLGGLVTDGAGARGSARGGTSLQRLLAQLHDGGVRSTGGIAADPFLVVHRSWVLHPPPA